MYIRLYIWWRNFEIAFITQLWVFGEYPVTNFAPVLMLNLVSNLMKSSFFLARWKLIRRINPIGIYLLWLFPCISVSQYSLSRFICNYICSQARDWAGNGPSWWKISRKNWITRTPWNCLVTKLCYDMHDYCRRLPSSFSHVVNKFNNCFRSFLKWQSRKFRVWVFLNWFVDFLIYKMCFGSHKLSMLKIDRDTRSNVTRVTGSVVKKAMLAGKIFLNSQRLLFWPNWRYWSFVSQLTTLKPFFFGVCWPPKRC